MSALNNKKRWEAEGKKENEQLYYKGVYHINGDIFHFSIRTSDSPSGNTWWHGEFRLLNGGIDIEILKEDWAYN